MALKQTYERPRHWVERLKGCAVETVDPSGDQHLIRRGGREATIGESDACTHLGSMPLNTILCAAA